MGVPARAFAPCARAATLLVGRRPAASPSPGQAPPRGSRRPRAKLALVARSGPTRPWGARAGERGPSQGHVEDRAPGRDLQAARRRRFVASPRCTRGFGPTRPSEAPGRAGHRWSPARAGPAPCARLLAEAGDVFVGGPATCPRWIGRPPRASQRPRAGAAVLELGGTAGSRRPGGRLPRGDGPPAHRFGVARAGRWASGAPAPAPAASAAFRPQ